MKSSTDSRPEEREDAATVALGNAPAPRMDPFTERRVRAAVLRGAAPARREAERGSGVRAAAVAGLAVAASIAGFFLLGPKDRQAPAPSESTIAETSEPALVSHVEMNASPDARYQREMTGSVERVTAQRGRFEFTVHAHAEGARFVVDTPDGEIEDVGTVFTVVVDGQRTTHISVARGAVVFRRPGLPPVRLEAGATFDVPATIASVAPTLSSTAGAPTDPAPRVARTAPSTAAPTPGDVAEDTAYMQVVALLREGRTEEAKVAARDYLRRFPDGFRRVEIARIAQ